MKFLIVKTSAIGDIIHSFPAVEYLKSRFPEAKIDWAVENSYKDLVAAHPLISQVFPISTQVWRKKLHHRLTWKAIGDFRKEIRQQKYDILFDLQGNTKSAVVTALADAYEKVGFGFHSVAERLNLVVTTHKYDIPQDLNIQETYLKLVQTHFKDLKVFQSRGVALRLTEAEETLLNQMVDKKGPRYLVAFGSNWSNKQLSEGDLKNFLEIVDREDHPYFYFIWGTEAEKQQAVRLQAHFEKSVVVERLSLPLLQGVMRKMDLVISMDSMALYLCGETPSFSVFGPSLAAVFNPSGRQHTYFQGSCPYGKVFSRRCPFLRSCSTGACLKNVTPEQLFARYQQQRIIKGV